MTTNVNIAVQITGVQLRDSVKFAGRNRRYCLLWLIMDPQYVYTKKRSEFGRQCFFADESPKLMENIVPNKQLHNDYLFKNPVNRSTQCSNILAEHEVIA
jgi:hypothetical protein